ncbi:restriction modification enzyme [Yersinia intermedia]|uniref:restriction endonuclease subunit S n=1 Tax=Yersinia intermedia TaxID=631 RepID=UPI0005DB9351|nr:restriction endonuclease subunit S [Yersinia intermedia]CNB23650.1 restriction modification enzyme [Yersinia intermedia]CNB46700.1 restriction modification enzyme [Yersinia intermedia]CNF89132.1 restriction modification enzyme [Yersinia intermedia]CRE46940.1 restriction modification enzyme [Yersinia intermedia]
MSTAHALPQGWTTIPLRYVCELNPSIAFDGFDQDDDLTFLPMDRVKSGYFIPNTDKFSKLASSYTAFEDGDIVLAKVTPCFENGNIAIAEDLVGGKGFGSSELFVVRPTEAERKFLFYYFQSSSFKQDGEASMTGAGGLKRVSPDVLRRHRLPFPGLDIQRLIANYLDCETARIDSLIAEKERMLALLEEKRSAFISRVVTRGLDPNAPLKSSNARWFDKTPMAWSVERLKWIIQSVSSGVSVNASDQSVEGDGFGVLKTSAVAGGAFLPRENKSVWDTEYERLACPVTRDTIIMSRMNTPNLVGESGYVAEDYPNLYLPDRLWQISFDAGRVFVPFMSLLLASKEARHALSAMATGTSPSMKNLAIEEMVSLLVPVPSLEEQKYIYEEVARREATIVPLKDELAKSLLLLKERRAALITAAVTGQLPLEEMTQ